MSDAEATEGQEKVAPVTPKELAAELGVDAKTVRRFLRSLVPSDQHPHKGGRWALDAGAIEELKERFAAYSNRTSKAVTLDDLAEELEIEELEEV